MPHSGVATLIAAAALFAACSRATSPLVAPGQSAVALTGGPNTSMIFVARTDSGLVAIDLGWWGHERALAATLRALNASAADVRAVFLTHSHRDHVGAWRAVRQATFHVARAERARLVGDAGHHGWIPRLADRVNDPDLPSSDSVTVRGFSRDTAFMLGRDTLRAYLVPGHTAGTAVYVFRKVLFAGDAITYTWRRGFAAARRGFSDDARIAARSLDSLWQRLPPGSVRWVCTAHARCAEFTPAFLADVAR